MLTVGLVAAAAVLVGLVLGAVPGLAALAAALGLLYLQNLLHLTRLCRWLREPDVHAVPRALGSWQQVFAAISRLVRMQSSSRTRLASTLARFRDAARAMPDGIVLLDADNRIEWCNPVAERHFSITSERDGGAQLSYFLRTPEFVGYLGAGDFRDPFVLRRGGQALSLQFVPFGDDQKLLISRDITRFEQLDTMRRDFIANVSHELRTPLTVVGGFIETLMETELEAPARLNCLRLMESQTVRMQRLIGDLLTLSRLESSQTRMKEVEVDVPDLVELLHEEALSLSAGRHQIHMRLETGERLLGAEEELLSAFGNLVSNAVRYTPEGGDVTLIWRREGEELVFAVQDTGEGVDAEHIPRLTERFFRVDRGRSRETGGTGLGLSIVKHVLSRHQARLAISSEPGAGSLFSARFPASRRLPAERD